MPNVNINVFIISMLLVVVYELHFGLVTLARANEVLLPLLVIVLYILFLLMLPNVKLQNLTPICYRDAFPIVKASLGTSGIVSYFTFLFIFGDRINNKENIKKFGFKLSAFLLISLVCVLATIIGSLYYTVAARSQLPFLLAVKQISLFDTLEKVESVVVTIWIVSDFVIISFFSLCALKLMKYCFNLSDTKPLINIYAVFMYFLTMYLCSNTFELEHLSNYFVIPGNIILGFVLPIIMFAQGKIRKKL